MKRHVYVPGYGTAELTIEGDTAHWIQQTGGSPCACQGRAAACEGWLPVEAIDWPGILDAMRQPPSSLSARSLRDARELLKSDYPTDAAQGWAIARHLFSLRAPAQALIRRLWEAGPAELRTEALVLLAAPVPTHYDKQRARDAKAKRRAVARARSAA